MEVLMTLKLFMRFERCMKNAAMPQETARCWISCFKNGNYDLKDIPHTDRLNEFDKERLNILFMKMCIKQPEFINCDKKIVVKKNIIFTHWIGSEHY